MYATDILKNADCIVGYDFYVELLAPIIDKQKVIISGMRREIERGQKAVDEALNGKTVAVVSSGDPGVYGMAGVILQLLDKQEQTIECEVVPGITAATAAAAVLGAPLMHDFAIISLSDLLTPYDLIMKRVDATSQGDMIQVLYNPKSMKRTKHIVEATEIMLKYKSPETPVGIVKNVYRENQEVFISTLGKLTQENIDMFTIVIIGNSQTYINNDKIITPRGYKI